jgi:hypothetical protein
MSTATNTPTTTPAATGSDQVARLAAEAADAAELRALTTHPDVIALRVEKVRTQVDRLLWAGIVLGLAFTAVNVQHFAAAGAPAYSLGWWVAWLLDPMVSLVLLAVLRAEQITARYQVPLNAWARRTKWMTFAATYVMNTWTSWGLTEGQPLSPSGIVLHSVPPLVVFFTAETGPGLRGRLTEAVHRALVEHATTITATSRPAALATDTAEVTGPVHEPVHEPRTTGRRRARRAKASLPRRSLADYIGAAREALDHARSAGASVEPTPAWCRRATGCSAGTSVKVAAALRAPAPSERHEAA